MRPDGEHLSKISNASTPAAVLTQVPSRQDQVPILAYHFTGAPIDEQDAPLTVATDAFERQVRYLIESDFRIIGLHQLQEAFFSRRAARSAVITFDDGRDCVFREAFPVLKKYGATATVFLISSRIGNPMFLSRDQISEMADHGISFGSHTVSHRRLSLLTTAEKRIELEHSRSELQHLLQRVVEFLAYPYGDFDAETQRLAVSAGYRGALSSRTGLAEAASDPFALPRVGIRRHDDVNRFAEKLEGQFAPPADQPAGLGPRLRRKIFGMAQKCFRGRTPFRS